MFYSAFAAIRSHEPSRQYYERKRAEEKRHNATVICLALRRCNVIFPMLKNKEPSGKSPPSAKGMIQNLQTDELTPTGRLRHAVKHPEVFTTTSQLAP
ncbi:IS110 family transposase [Corynebacterium diphtheriae]|nr:transposase-like protein [Corynebacterium diphtheriae HC02]AEX84174.1 transposase-like protein [Corynebacterium diphtheriae VA01]OLN12159.1 IS110 family transposase [Corynebacterium diphtheriae]OWM45760.1 IS110 family transposase [Corynebacterium diphtheriae]OWM53881.1 IS110 family transposase [Corynebacterium diphtheriae]